MNNQQIIDIMEATGRFNYCESGDDAELEFYDIEFEGYHYIPVGSDLGFVIKYLIKIISEESYEFGKEEVKRGLRKLIGLSHI